MPVKHCPRPAWDPVTITYETVAVTGRTITRPTRVEGTVGGPAVAALPATMFPVSAYPAFAPGGGGEPGAGEDHDDLPIGYHRGHILARSLGGVNSAYNLVPIPQAINNGTWAQMEIALGAAHAGAALLAARVYFRADLAYAHPNAGDPTIPNRVSAWGYLLPTLAAGAALPGARTAALTAAIAAGLPNRVHHIVAADFSAAGDAPMVFNGAQDGALNAVVTAFNGWANKPMVGGLNIGGTPTGGRGDPPAGTALGPYAFLDVLEDGALGPPLVGALNVAFVAEGLNYPAGGAVKRNQHFAVAFTQPQKRLIRIANRWMNAGRMTSDNEWFDFLRRVRPSEAEIDRVIPMAAAAGDSSNFYWNAQVTSKEYKVLKGNQRETAFQANFMAQPSAGSGGAMRRVRRRTNRYTQ